MPNEYKIRMDNFISIPSQPNIIGTDPTSLTLFTLGEGTMATAEHHGTLPETPNGLLVDWWSNNNNIQYFSAKICVRTCRRGHRASVAGEEIYHGWRSLEGKRRKTDMLRHLRPSIS